jgi:hypothetical protein
MHHTQQTTHHPLVGKLLSIHIYMCFIYTHAHTHTHTHTPIHTASSAKTLFSPLNLLRVCCCVCVYVCALYVCVSVCAFSFGMAWHATRSLLRMC